MQTLIHADIFFFISSIAFIIFTILGIIFMVYLISILHDVKQSSQLLKGKIEGAEEDVVRFRKKIEESFVFNLIFAKRHKRK